MKVKKILMASQSSPCAEATSMSARTPVVRLFFIPVTVYFAPVLAAVLATSAASAEDLPELRAGMWEFNRTIESASTTGKPQAIQTKKCISPNEDMKKQNAMLTKMGCKFSPVSRSGNTYSYSAVCNLQGASGTSKSELTVENDSAYVIRIESNLGGAPTSEVLRAKRVGDCPP